MSEISENIKKCKTFSEIAKLFGYDYYNGGLKKILIKKCFLYNIDIEKQIKSYRERKNFCLNCGKEITGENRTKRKFCCQSCANSYNNKKRLPKTIEQREKISEKTKETLVRNNFKLLSDCIKNGLVLNQHNVLFKDKLIGEKKYIRQKCVVCGKYFKPFLNKNGHLYTGKVCSDNCSLILRKENSSKTYEKLVDEGRFQGWKSRNILSYPEKFWTDVLNNNEIKFVTNKPIKCGNTNYFLDFYIELNDRKIDLEIDGKQHKYEDRLKSDKKRDEFIIKNGIEVYRIDWNEINSKDGKLLMKEKIDNFLNFLK